MGGIPGLIRSRTSKKAAEPEHPESGFAFVEVVIASIVLLISVVAVGSQLGTQFLSISTSARQQAAAGLLNQAMEEVRALPYTFVANGLSVSDGTVTSDPNILVSGQNCTTNNSAIWSTAETIPCAAPSGESQAPLVPHISYPVIDSTTFAVAAYPSIDAADSSSGQDVYRVTVIVSWHSSQPGLKQVIAQTLVYSAASGCITQTNHPFAAPCQPFLYAGTSAGGGYVNVTPEASSSNPAISGINLNSIEMLLALDSSEAEIEQVSTVLGEVQTTGGSISTGSSSDTGKSSASVSADNDPGTARGTSNTPATVANSSPSAIEASGSGSDANWISVVPGSGDSGSTTATANASSSPACDDLAGNLQLTGLPCGSSSVSQLGSAASLLMGLYAGSSSLGTAPLASVTAQSASYPDETFASRYTSSGGTYCSSTSGDGCVHAGAQEALGAVELAGLPAQFVTDGAVPTDWGTGSSPCPAANYLLAVVNFSAGASSESGVSAGSPSASVPLSGAPTPYLCYWTATGYVAQPITWGASPPSVTFPTVNVTDPTIGSGVTVSMTPTLQLQGTSVSSSLPSGCSSVCTANASVPSPVTGDIVYVVSEGGTIIADLDVHVNLGEIEADTSYQAAP